MALPLLEINPDIPDSARGDHLQSGWNYDVWRQGTCVFENGEQIWLPPRLFDLPDNPDEINGQRMKLCQTVLETPGGLKYRINRYLGNMQSELLRHDLGLSSDENVKHAYIHEVIPNAHGGIDTIIGEEIEVYSTADGRIQEILRPGQE